VGEGGGGGGAAKGIRQIFGYHKIVKKNPNLLNLT